MSTPIGTFIERASREVNTAKVRAVDAGARVLVTKRAKGVEEYPAMDAMRDRAREIRLHTLAHLDTYLEQFADSVEALGGKVFFAKDADEANEYIRGVVRDAGAELIVKSKSMVTEEIGLNAVLEADGREIVETDLGEFIVQLAHEHPSHIVAPVMHKTRQDVGELFTKELDVPYTEDPEELNQVARQYLRQRFLRADVGVSGANFGVASTGSICLVTNEGNGRLTTTAPRIHIAVMGMERLVPTPGDLGVMLEILARSAVGQRLSVYTNIVTGPRREDDPDGPDEFHVVILDNGRSRVLGDSTAEILACIRCGACLNICPVYREVSGHAYSDVYSGPMGAVLVPSLHGIKGNEQLPYASTLCGACLDVCPVRIELPDLLLALRERVVQDGDAFRWLGSTMSAYKAVATRPRVWRTALSSGALFGRAARSGWVGRLPGPGSAWTDSRDLPAPAKESFHDWWRKHHGT